MNSHFDFQGKFFIDISTISFQFVMMFSQLMCIFQIYCSWNVKYQISIILIELYYFYKLLSNDNKYSEDDIKYNFVSQKGCFREKTLFGIFHYIFLIFSLICLRFEVKKKPFKLQSPVQNNLRLRLSRKYVLLMFSIITRLLQQSYFTT